MVELLCTPLSSITAMRISSSSGPQPHCVSYGRVLVEQEQGNYPDIRSSG
jgi:hypothetical protein